MRIITLVKGGYMSLSGKTVIVTGGSRGIGRAIATRLGRDGASVVVHYRQEKDGADDSVTTIRNAGSAAIAVQGDLAVEGDIRRIFRVARDEFGGVDIVVNNAATVIGGPIEAYTEDAFDRLVAVNLRSLAVSAQEASSILPEGGRIVNVAAGLTSDALSVLGLYGATKAGVETLTRSLALQLGPRGITVNAVAPGPTDTDMLTQDARENLPAIIAQTALRRLGRPDDIARVVAFLVGEDGGWVTGQTIHADGGRF